MKKLVCEMCNGAEFTKEDGMFVCQSCGMKYSVEEAKKLINQDTSYIYESDNGLDRVGRISEQSTAWKTMADDAFNNGNYTEAYTYYCKVLEKNVNDWFSTYRKGMCMGWQATLNNMYANVVLGGVVDATKLLYVDETQTDYMKAAGSVLMATEVHNWIQAVNSLAVEHCNQYGNELVSAAKEFYQEEQIISSAIKFNIDMITEFVYENYENKKELKLLVNALCDLGETIIGNMNATFKIKTDSKWNYFWETYEDVYTNISPDYYTQNACKELSVAIKKLRGNWFRWEENYKKRIKQERIMKYWEEHAVEKQQYEARIVEIDTELKELKDKLCHYDNTIAEIKKELKKQLPEEVKLNEIKQQQNSLKSQKSQLGLFAGKEKKQLREQINSIQSDIDYIETLIVSKKKQINDDVDNRVAVVENECSPHKKRIEILEKEKAKINNELTMDR